LVLPIDKNDQGGFNMARIAQEWRTRFLGLKLKARVPEVMVVLRAAHGGLWMFLLFDFTGRYQIYDVKANLRGCRRSSALVLLRLRPSTRKSVPEPLATMTVASSRQFADDSEWEAEQ
jgi:hypothetical protein